METQKNLLEIIEKCPKETVFYCTLIGECTVEIDGDEQDSNPLRCTSTVNPHEYYWLTEEGKYRNIGFGECILFPSKDQRDWSKFGIPKPDLLIDTPVAVSNDREFWELRLYAGGGYTKVSKGATLKKQWDYIAPLDKMDFTPSTGFAPKENYGTASGRWD